MIIVCDLDRTLVPNGAEEYDGSLEEFYKRVSELKDVVLVYATGRNLDLFLEAEKEYNLKIPDFFLGSVGTEVFQKKKSFLSKKTKLVPDPDWQKYVRERHPNWNREKIIQGIKEITGEFFGENSEQNFYLQESGVQNENKISYYLKGEDLVDEITFKLEEYINKNKILAEVVYSFDPHKNLGLVDVLPKYATKLGAVEFLVKKLGRNLEDVVYCGDSGNDLLPLTSGIKSILVKNAREDVKQKALEIVKEKRIEDKLYIARGNNKMNGNYSSGVIEGLEHFKVLK
ncbi:MAG: HAD-IIB family hydrolase [Bacteriovoracia bacterium]